MDVGACIECGDHPDVARFSADALAAMPELDAVTHATPLSEETQVSRFSIADGWLATDAELFIEVNTEGDYLDGVMLPTPTTPEGEWDIWSIEWGYPYRGQPSVVYRVPLRIESGFEARTTAPDRHTDIHGLSGDLYDADDGTIADDSTGRPGSGADRLLADPDGTRVRVRVTSRPCP